MSDPMDPTTWPLDFGSNVYGRWTMWSPDRDLNPQYADVPDIDPLGLILAHMHDDEWHRDHVTLDVPGAREIFPDRPVWQVESMEPLTLSPSILNRICGWHGYIRNGKWENC